jgi:hypothetical protein
MISQGSCCGEASSISGDNSAGSIKRRARRKSSAAPPEILRASPQDELWGT